MYSWRFTSSGVCFLSAGTGVQTRAVQCLRPDGKPGLDCDASQRPAETRACGKPCPQWHVGAWSSCSRSCGKGFKRRALHCTHTELILQRDHCSGLRKPQELDFCNLREFLPLKHQMVYRFYFYFFLFNLHVEEDVSGVGCQVTSLLSLWGVCSLGRMGVSKRSARRRDKEDDDNDALKASYDKEDSSTPKWIFMNWDACSTSCGEGVQTRAVQCLRPDGKPGLDCDASQRPAETRACGKPCPQWHVGAWSSCSRSCGKGFKRRALHCTHTELILQRDHCSGLRKPQELDFCNLREC
uniref:Uncharacterized protein n=1 Tax=Gouania willdenowi TaxID=441366 RepID=A0A8C5EHC4_GOUWI